MSEWRTKFNEALNVVAPYTEFSFYYNPWLLQQVGFKEVLLNGFVPISHPFR